MPWRAALRSSTCTRHSTHSGSVATRSAKTNTPLRHVRPRSGFDCCAHRAKATGRTRARSARRARADPPQSRQPTSVATTARSPTREPRCRHPARRLQCTMVARERVPRTPPPHSRSSRRTYSPGSWNCSRRDMRNRRRRSGGCTNNNRGNSPTRSGRRSYSRSQRSNISLRRRRRRRRRCCLSRRAAGRHLPRNWHALHRRRAVGARGGDGHHRRLRSASTLALVPPPLRSGARAISLLAGSSPRLCVWRTRRASARRRGNKGMMVSQQGQLCLCR